MSSWYDSTARILKALDSSQSPPVIWSNVVEARLKQVESYLREARKDPASRLRGDFYFAHPALFDWGKRARISAEADIFLALHQVILWAGKAATEQDLYQWTLGTPRLMPLNELMLNIFDRCHSLGHELARVSDGLWNDNPFPYVAKARRYKSKGKVFDSDAYLREVYPAIVSLANGH